MKVAFCTVGDDLTAALDNRFGRAAKFLIVDISSSDIVVVENDAKNAASGAGNQAVQLLANQEIDAVVAPELGPKALDALNLFQIKAFRQGELSIVKDALLAFEDNQLELYQSATHKGMYRA